MRTTQQDAIAVAGVAVGGAISVSIGEGAWDVWGIPFGLMLLLILVGFVNLTDAAQWPWTARGGFSLAAGLCVMIMTGWIPEMLLGRADPVGPLQLYAVDYVTLPIWGVASLLIYVRLSR